MAAEPQGATTNSFKCRLSTIPALETRGLPSVFPSIHSRNRLEADPRLHRARDVIGPK
jgi:hypothetical protein